MNYKYIMREEEEKAQPEQKIEEKKSTEQTGIVTIGTEQSCLGEARTLVPRTIEATAKHIMFGVALSVDCE